MKAQQVAHLADSFAWAHEIARRKLKPQAKMILILLHTYRGEWVGLPLVLDLRIGQYNARIKELREAGFNIENRKARAPDGRMCSWYRLAGQQSLFTEAA